MRNRYPGTCYRCGERDELSAKFMEMQEFAVTMEAERDAAVAQRDALAKAADKLVWLKRLKRKIEAGTATDEDARTYRTRKAFAWVAIEKALAGMDEGRDVNKNSIGNGLRSSNMLDNLHADLQQAQRERDAAEAQRDALRDKFKAAWKECERVRHATQQQRDVAEQERNELYARLEAMTDPHFFDDIIQLVYAVQCEPGCVHERDAADRVMKKIQEWEV